MDIRIVVAKLALSRPTPSPATATVASPSLPNTSPLPPEGAITTPPGNQRRLPLEAASPAAVSLLVEPPAGTRAYLELALQHLHGAKTADTLLTIEDMELTKDEILSLQPKEQLTRRFLMAFAQRVMAPQFTVSIWGKVKHVPPVLFADLFADQQLFLPICLGT